MVLAKTLERYFRSAAPKLRQRQPLAYFDSVMKEGSVIEYFVGENLDLIRFCDCDLDTILTSFYKKFFRIRLFYWLKALRIAKQKTSNQESNWSARKRKIHNVPSVVYVG